MGNCLCQKLLPIFVEHHSPFLPSTSGEYRYYLRVNKHLEVCYCIPFNRVNLTTRNDLIAIALAYDNEIKKYGLARFETAPCFNSSRVAHILKKDVTLDLAVDSNKWVLIARPDGLTYDLRKTDI